MDTIASPLRADEGAPHEVDEGKAPTSDGVVCHALLFGGSGSEYFRIWIGNLLLTVLTVGVYYPWAKVRTLRYFRGHTTLAGGAFDFHGRPKRMLRGYALIWAMFLVYSIAGRVSPMAGATAFLGLVALWPALFRASVRFRLANTSWRGRRFAFDGGAGRAYLVWLPLLAPVICLFVATAFGDSERAAGRARTEVARLVVATMGISALVFLALVPLSWWLVKRYQHDHYRLGGLRTHLGAGVGRFYGLSAKIGLLALLVTIVPGMVTLLVLGTLMGPGGGERERMPVQVAAAGIVAYAMLILFVQPYLSSRLQNLVWSNTSAPGLRFVSTLGFWPLVGLTAKNWLLVLLTLGMYLPFAAVASARMRINAVLVCSRIDLDRVLDERPEPVDDATGEAAGDLLDIDLGY